MQRFLVRRVFTLFITMWLVSMAIFALSRATGDPRAALLDDNASREQYEAVGRALGIDKPLWRQYAIWIGNMSKGDFGDSFHQRRPVIDLIRERLWPTAQLAIAAILLSVLVGVPLGVMSALKRGTILDYVMKVFALVGQAAPSFWLGIMMIFLFAVKLDWLPPSGRQDMQVSLLGVDITGTSMILPAITLGYWSVSVYLRLTRSALLEVLDSEYIKLARAKGVSRLRVIWVHGMRNALISPLTYTGLLLGGLVTGSLIVETVFAWPGMGQLAVNAMFTADYALLQGAAIFFTLVYVLAALAVDVLYAYVDPRIRYT